MNIEICVQEYKYRCISANDQHQTQICHFVLLPLDRQPNCRNLSPYLSTKTKKQFSTKILVDQTTEICTKGIRKMNL